MAHETSTYSQVETNVRRSPYAVLRCYFQAAIRGSPALAAEPPPTSSLCHCDLVPWTPANRMSRSTYRSRGSVNAEDPGST